MMLMSEVSKSWSKVKYAKHVTHNQSVYRVAWNDEESIELHLVEGQPEPGVQYPLQPGLSYLIDNFEPCEEGWLPPNPKKAFGASKPDLSLIPPSSLAHMAMSMEEGGWKYGPYNFRESKIEARTYVAAAMRHLGDWLDGEEMSLDAEVHNLGAVMACCGILLDAIENGNLIDNRPKKGNNARVLERLQEQKKKWKAENRKQWSPGSKL